MNRKIAFKISIVPIMIFASGEDERASITSNITTTEGSLLTSLDTRQGYIQYVNILNIVNIIHAQKNSQATDNLTEMIEGIENKQDTNAEVSADLADAIAFLTEKNIIRI
ncbi:MAG: hypothetical protein LUI02_03060 [Clostridiales bacterium]|nr:hypothetical protein [Clostridiales bacterium]